MTDKEWIEYFELVNDRKPTADEFAKAKQKGFGDTQDSPAEETPELSEEERAKNWISDFENQNGRKPKPNELISARKLNFSTTNPTELAPKAQIINSAAIQPASQTAYGVTPGVPLDDSQQRIQFAQQFMMMNAKYFNPEDVLRIQNAIAALPVKQQYQLSAAGLRDPQTILLVSIFLGQWGVDRFMVGDKGLGILKICASLVPMLTLIIYFITLTQYNYSSTDYAYNQSAADGIITGYFVVLAICFICGLGYLIWHIVDIFLTRKKARRNNGSMMMWQIQQLR
jgi:hypothetical protein